MATELTDLTSVPMVRDITGPFRDPGRHGVAVEDSPRRVRAFFNHEAVADSRRMKLLFETGHLPVYYFPLDDIRSDLLVPTSHTTHCPYKGDARYWSVKVGDRVAENAVWSYPNPLPGCPDISALAAFYWKEMDAWFEEDEEVYVHARDPYHRVDILESSRHVEVTVDGVKVADSHRPRLLFETGLPTRYYLPTLDVRMDLLQPTESSSACPYKGVASYWSVRAGDRTIADLVWGYRYPLPAAAKIAGHLCFYNEKVDLTVDGERQERPKTKWS